MSKLTAEDFLLLLSCPVASDSLQPRALLRTRPLSEGFPRQEYWSGLPFPSPGDLPDPGMEPTSPAWAGRFFTTEQIFRAVNCSERYYVGGYV